MTKLSLTHLCKNYRADGRDIAAVEDVTVQIADAEFLVLAGPPGCGKSTILRIIAGLEQPSKGDVYLRDECVTTWPARDRRVGMVFERNELYPGKTVSDTLAFTLKWRGYSKPESAKRIKDAATIVGIEDLLPRRSETLSWIECRGVALSRAIVHQPAVLVIEAPPTNLQSSARAELRERLSKLHQRLQIATVYATRDAMEAMSLGDRAVVMKEGRVQEMGPSLQLYRRPETMFVAQFLGSLPMNLIHGTLRVRRDSLVFQEIKPGNIEFDFGSSAPPSAGEFAGKPVVLGLRPEAIDIANDTPPTPAHVTFRAIVDVIERLGSASELHLHTGAHVILCLTKETFGARDAGRRLQLQFDPNDAHLFEPTTGRRIV